MNAVLVFLLSSLALSAAKPVIETTPVLSTATVLSTTQTTSSVSTEAAQNTPIGTAANLPETSTKTLAQDGDTELTEGDVKPEGSAATATATATAVAAAATKNNNDNSKDNDSDESDSGSDSDESKEAIVTKPQPVDLLRKTRESRRRDETYDNGVYRPLDENDSDDQPIQIIF